MATEFDKFLKQQSQATKPNVADFSFNAPEVKIPNTRDKKKLTKRELDELKQKLSKEHPNLVKILKPFMERQPDGRIKLNIKKRYIFLLIAILVFVNPILIIFAIIFWLSFKNIGNSSKN